MITGLFERKSEYRIKSAACLFDERVERYDQSWLNATKFVVVCGLWLLVDLATDDWSTY